MIPEDDMTAEQQRAYLEWCELRNKAEKTMDRADAAAAGKAYARFFDTFIITEPLPSATVLRFPGGTAR